MFAHTLTAVVLSVLTFAAGAPPTPTPPPPTPIAPEPATYAPILMYHKIGGPNGRFNVSAAQFAAQMKWLKDNDYQSVSVDQIAAAIRGQAALPPKPIAITFDDGWRAQFTLAKPILDEYGFKATFYLPTNYVSSTAMFMSWQDVAALNAEGHWIGSHSLSHTSAAQQSAAQLQNEMAASRDILAQHIGKPVTGYCYPYGSTSKFAQAMAERLGFSYAVGVVSHWQQKPKDLYNLHRIEVNGAYDMASFIGWVTGHPRRVFVSPPAMKMPEPKSP